MQHVSESPAVHRIAVIGSGVSGLTAAHVAARAAHVTLYEADDRLGGHADTHEVHEGSRTLAIDTGFIVHNPRTYPVLLRLFEELGVTTQPSEMSMSTRDDGTGLEWAGALGLGGLVPTARTLGRGRYLRMLTEIPRFDCRARALLGGPDDERTLRRFLADGGFSAYFERHFMEPLVAAVWSCDPDVALDYPACYLFTFLEHHGMLGIFGLPEWRTVSGGSREYVDRLAAVLPDVRTGCKVTSIAETPDGVHVTDGNGWVYVVRRRSGRHPPRPGPVDARRADDGPAQGAVGAAVLRQRGAPAHRHLGTARGPPGPGVLELPPADGPRRGRGRHLRPDSAAAARHRDHVPRHAWRGGASSTPTP